MRMGAQISTYTLLWPDQTVGTDCDISNPVPCLSLDPDHGIPDLEFRTNPDRYVPDLPFTNLSVH